MVLTIKYAGLVTISRARASLEVGTQKALSALLPRYAYDMYKFVLPEMLAMHLTSGPWPNYDTFSSHNLSARLVAMYDAALERGEDVNAEIIGGVVCQYLTLCTEFPAGHSIASAVQVLRQCVTRYGNHVPEDGAPTEFVPDSDEEDGRAWVDDTTGELPMDI